MRITLRELRKKIRKSLAGSQPEEDYSTELFDDPSVEKPSVYVPDDIKKKLKSWAQDMHLSTK